jgi:hypothetical protein
MKGKNIVFLGFLTSSFLNISCSQEKTTETNSAENKSIEDQTEEYTEGMTADNMPYYLSDEAQYNQYWADFQLSLAEGLEINWNSFIEIQGQLGEDYKYLFEDEYTKEAILQSNYWDFPYVQYNGEKVREFSVAVTDGSGMLMGTKFLIAERPNGLKIVGYEGF